MGILSETRQFYKQRKEEERQKKLLIRNNMDFGLLEQLIQKVNENPDLRIEVRLADGAKLLLKSYHKVEVHDLINGNIEVVE